MAYSKTSTTNFDTVSAIYEQQAENTTYTVYEITRDARVMTSHFQSKTRAFEYARQFTDENSRVYVYKTKCIKVFDPLSDGGEGNLFNQNVDMLLQAASLAEEDTDPEYVPSDEDDDGEDYTDMPELEAYHDLTGLTFTEYGKGYLLSPRRNTSFRGEKYLMGGWWNHSLSGWIFRSMAFDELIAAGASYAGKSVNRATHAESLSAGSRTRAATNSSGAAGPSPFESERDLTGFTIEPYGKGIILRCGKSQSVYKQKLPYLLGNLGWWNASGKGWFFQSQYVAELQRLGATVIKQEPSTSNMDDFITTDSQFFADAPTFSQYGKGWLLPASSTYKFKDHGKYFEGGFWMAAQNGWFFRTRDRDAFLSQFNQ
jgi:hypothetical protein